MKKKNVKWLRLAVNLLLLLFLFAVLAYSMGNCAESLPFDNERALVLNDGWLRVTEDGLIPVDLPSRLKGEDTATITLIRTLPQTVPKPAVLGFRSSQQRVVVKLEGKTIYTYGWGGEEQRSFGKTDGSAWNLVRLPDGCEGGKITVELTSIYDNISSKLNGFYLGSKTSLLFAILHQHLGSLIITFLIFIVGAGLLIFAFLTRRFIQKDFSTLYLGVFAILISVWMFGESQLVQFFTGNLLGSLTLTFFAMLSTPIPVMKYIGSLESFRYRRLAKIIAAVFYAQLYVVFFLQFLNILDFMEIVNIVHLILIISCCVLFSTLLIDLIYNRNRKILSVVITLGVLSLFCILEVAAYYLWNDMSAGNFMRIGVLLFVLLQSVVVVRNVMGFVRKGREAEYYAALAVRDALTQCANRTAYEQRLADGFLDGTVIIMADINDLKHINDNWGHSAGDEAIVRCARLLVETFGSHGECYRIGGDEFVVICENLQAEEGARLLRAFGERCAQQRRETAYPFDVAGGMSVYDKERDIDFADAVKRADGRMYVCKDHKKDGE